VPENAEVHSGFLEAYELAREHIHKITSGESNIVICGHSLGGAIAVLCALDLKLKNPHKSISAYTYGKPRVGNKHFRNFINKGLKKSLFRVVYSADMVTRVPLLILGYRHEGTKVHLNGGKWTKVHLNGGKWWRIITNITGRPLDHYPQKYKKAILKI